MWIKPFSVILLAAFFFIISSVKALKNKNRKILKQTPEEIIPGTISQGLTYLVGVAGGIYISLIALTSFLKIVFPKSILLFGVSVDPLAVISFLLAVLQPWVINCYYSISNK